MGITSKVMETIVAVHSMVIETALCSRFRTPKSDCSRCADVCPAGAIEISDKGAEIKKGCIDCGVCYSACPNGAFNIKGRDDKKIISEIRDAIVSSQLPVFSISCEKGNTKADLILSCLSRLTEALLFEPVRMGISRIEILQPACEECPLANASPHLQRIIQQTRYLYGMAGIKKDRITIIGSAFGDRKSSKLKTQNPEPEMLSRRELFKSFGVKAAGIAAASIPDTEQENKGEGEVFREAIGSRHENLKRSLLLKSLREIAPDGKGQETVNVPSEDAISAELEVASECTGCGVCAKLCPAGAITQRVTEDYFNLSFRPDLCTNCRICVKTCMPRAVKIKDTVSLNLLLEQNDVILFKAKKKICIVCKTDFIGEGSDICPLCMNRHKKQAAMMQSLFGQEINREQNR